MVWSIVLILLGLFALALPWEAGLGVAVVVAVMIIVAGIARTFRGFAGAGTRHRVWSVIVGVAYIIAGLFLLARPNVTLISLTLVLAILFIIQGVLVIGGWSLVRRLRGSGWLLADGIVALVLGILISVGWPASAIWAVGTLLGANLIVSGWAGLMWTSTSRGHEEREDRLAA